MKIAQWTHEWAQSRKFISIYKDVIGSTNTHAKIFNHTKDSLVVTDLQPEGRGRGDHTWETPKKGTALLSSWVFLREYAPQPIFAPLIGLAVYKALELVFQIKSMSLKAPNDIYIQDKKLGGILIEIETQGVTNKIIVGLGINMLDKPKLKTATFLQAHRKAELTKNKFLEFLTQVHINMDQALIDAKTAEISQDKRKELLIALNKNPLLIEKYTEVLADGSLTTKDKIVPWFNL